MATAITIYYGDICLNNMFFVKQKYNEYKNY